MVYLRRHDFIFPVCSIKLVVVCSFRVVELHYNKGGGE